MIKEDGDRLIEGHHMRPCNHCHQLTMWFCWEIGWMEVPMCSIECLEKWWQEFWEKDRAANRRESEGNE